jgi:Family of unknown function (DUF6011)
MNAKEPTTGRYLFEDDFQDSSFDTTRQTPEEIRKNAHITSGGEQALVPCVKCGGSGMTRWGSCFRCKGRGRISVRSAAASKGAQTARENLREKQARTYASPEWAYINKRADKGSTFYQSFIEKIDTYGELTENQLAVVHKDMAKDAEFFAKRDAERSGTVGVDRINALFETAKANGLTRPIFRTERLTIKRAPANGRNPGALYVTDRDLGGEYVGMIKDGVFKAKYGAKPDTLKLLCEIAENPLEAAVKYGRSTGNCCICDRELTDPVSVANGIGPYCAARFGF